MQEGDLELKQMVTYTKLGNLLLNLEGSYRIYKKLPHVAYKLEELDERLNPRTWNWLILDIIITKGLDVFLLNKEKALAHRCIFFLVK